MWNMWAHVDRESRCPQGAIQRLDQFEVLLRHPARAPPANSVVPPIVRPVEDQVERLAPYGVCAGKQGIQLLGRRAAEKGQRDMQGVGMRAATAPVPVQFLTGTVERFTRGVVRPQGKKKPERLWLGPVWLGQARFRSGCFWLRFSHVRSGTRLPLQCLRHVR